MVETGKKVGDEDHRQDPACAGNVQTGRRMPVPCSSSFACGFAAQQQVKVLFLCYTVFVWPDSTFFAKSCSGWTFCSRGVVLNIGAVDGAQCHCPVRTHGHGFSDAFRGRGIAESADRRTRPAGDRVSGQPSCPVAAVASLVVGAACASGELGIWMSKIL